MPGTLYIIGAGASKADTQHLKFPLPLATEFFQPRYTSAYWPPGHKSNFRTSMLRRVLEQYFSLGHGKYSEASIQAANVEEVYSFLHCHYAVYRAQSIHPEYLETARKELLEYIVCLVNGITSEVKTPALYSVLAKGVRPLDTIVSFNWDVLLELALQRTPIGRKLLKSQERIVNPLLSSKVPSYEDNKVRQLHEGLLLKLHGGTNLTVCTNRECLRHSFPYLWHPDVWGSPDYWGCEACGASTEILIMPPYVHKSYATSRFFSLQANLAAQKLGMADEIVILGYSLSQYDFEAQTMIRCSRVGIGERIEDPSVETFLRRVVLVNPQVETSEYVGRARNLFGLEARQSHGHKVELALYESIHSFLKMGSHTARPGKTNRKRRRCQA